MPRIVPSAKQIAARVASTIETVILKIRPKADPRKVSKAVRSAQGMIALLIRAVSNELREVHDHLSWWGRMYFPDTAKGEFIPRHASIWGVELRPATKAIGLLEIIGNPGTQIVTGTEFSQADGIIYISSEASEIGMDGEASVSVFAAIAGINGNLEADINLATVEPNPDISSVRVSASGLLGGADEETPQSQQAATLSRIRQRAHGGAGFDYPYWLGRSYPVKSVKVLPDWIGRGSVGIAPVIQEANNPYGREPTQGELDAMAITLGRPSRNEGLRPVTAHVVMVPTTCEQQPLTVRLRPDTIATRQAVTLAWQRHIATLGDDDDLENESAVGATIEPSRISQALSAANGEYAHDLVVPAEPYELPDTVFPTPAEPVFEAAL